MARISQERRRKTLDDVPGLALVSPITVSRALRSPDIVSLELRQRIETAVAKLGYVPNVAASRPASSRSHTVSVIVPTLYNVIFAEYLRALHDVFLISGRGRQQQIPITKKKKPIALLSGSMSTRSLLWASITRLWRASISFSWAGTLTIMETPQLRNTVSRFPCFEGKPECSISKNAKSHPAP